MTARKAETSEPISKPVGTIIEVPDPAEVTLPNGQAVRVVGGRYAIEVKGEHTVKAG